MADGPWVQSQQQGPIEERLQAARQAEAGGGVPVAGVVGTSTPAMAPPPSSGGVVKPGGTHTGVGAPDAATEAPTPPPPLPKTGAELSRLSVLAHAAREGNLDIDLEAHGPASPLALHRERLIETLRSATANLPEWEAEQLADAVLATAVDIQPLLALIHDLTDGGDCRYDHHGYCQEHGWFETDPPCPHKRAKEQLAALRDLAGGEQP